LAHAAINNAVIGNSFPNAQAYPLQGTAQQPYAAPQSVQYVQNPLLSNLGQPASPLVPATQNPYAASAASQSPWGTPDPSGTKRPGPFDAPHPTSRNTTVVRQPSPWERTSRAPWVSSQPASPADAWADQEHSLTVSNLEQHNQQQHKPEGPAADIEGELENLEPETKSGEEPLVEAAPVAPAPAPAVEKAPVIETPAPSKPRRKTPLVVKPSESPQATIITPKTPTPPLPSPAPQTKAAWSKEEESTSAKPSGVAIGFREIQEAEAKKAEARKAAERERERAARAAAVTPSEDSPSFTASWGLPTSQVGRTNSGKDVSAGTSPITTTATTQPVWTTAAKTPTTKKTMKEIQEEEERRKKLEATKEKETVSAAARRAHTETNNKPTPVLPGPAWTTVGSSGKAAVTAPPARPAAVTSSSALSVAPASSSRPGNATPISPRPAVTPKPATATPKTEDAPVNPSHEFLRWLGDSLKGLNSTVNLEDMSSMLLSFPLDADSSTMEIISDLIYASSTTLDGRRFAAEFVAKRKADAASRPKGAASAGVPGKLPSIADVVKAQPKPTQNEWGGFKVVNKKKKGGKA